MGLGGWLEVSLEEGWNADFIRYAAAMIFMMYYDYSENHNNLKNQCSILSAL